MWGSRIGFPSSSDQQAPILQDGDARTSDAYV